jgi:hypothetical protein
MVVVKGETDMKIINLWFSFLAAFLLCLFISTSTNADDNVYGWQLMTEQERMEHRDMMRSLNTREERETYRNEHHQKMMERAKKRGVNLPDEPLQRGRGFGAGGDPGRGGGRR